MDNDKKKSRRKENKPGKKPGEREKVNRNKILLKTSIDSIVGGLLSVGIFQSPTLEIETISGYLVIIGFLVLLIILLYIYALRYNNLSDFYTSSIVITISIIEVYIIGMALNQSLEIIGVVILIVLPSMLIFDKLMG